QSHRFTDPRIDGRDPLPLHDVLPRPACDQAGRAGEEGGRAGFKQGGGGMSGANVSPLGRNEEEMAGANVSPSGRNEEEMSAKEITKELTGFTNVPQHVEDVLESCKGTASRRTF